MLSRLQQYILEECLARGGQCQRRIFDNSLEAKHSRATAENYKKIVTQSIERLIERGLAVGYGLKTREKLFIEKVRITAAGRKQIKLFRNIQQPKLPLNKHARNKN